ncbi:MAG: hypothetical protein QW726_04190, partial [Fervidicoccaceae archaeon]
MSRFERGGREERFPRKFEGREREERRGRYREEEQTPAPIDGKCNNLCPLFWCTKRAYQIRRDPRSGKKYVF